MAGREELQADMDDMARRLIAGGFAPAGEIVESVVEVFKEDAPGEDLTPAAHTIVASALADHLAAQRDWPKETDCDRLDRAFDQLNRSGIVAVQNAPCCQTCGVDHCFTEMARRINAGERIRGYTFYHEQDTEAAVEGYGICLAYGSTKRWKRSKLAIGREVARVLGEHGFDVQWDGSLGKRISAAMDWKRRR